MTTASSDPALLEVSNLRVRFGHVDAVRDVSLAVGRSRVVTLLGPNGAGKTTTLKAICGLLRPARGEIRINGRRTNGVVASRVTKLGVGLVPEGRRIFPAHTVKENLELGGFIWRRQRPVFDETLASVLELFPRLADRLDQLAGSLSGGEAQMLAVGRAMMTRPSLLILDEPSLGLAPKIVDELYDFLGTIRDQQQLSILLVEQAADRALRFADDAYLLSQGRVVASGPAEALREDDQVRSVYFGGLATS
ncbi:MULTISPECIES: ABC transporter ATP-binding protein [unclassified Nocardioides]|uniref:ABC transporter ATP-binding protein n=1 Tax=unclassified Nocardioides TaxID=2615069 RepID=UPI000056F313|nr:MULTISPECIES: ABC transporter ATP-binding protein [unclassified Nocardioides]ABL83599.1 amino acid/amide ABC transporter ATP-binding protein 2, HAAT family [Nocardioides sp. JS614]